MAGYCTQAQIESILSEHGVLAFTDDDHDGISDGTLIQDAIDRSASLKIDFYLCQRYDLTQITNNSWVQYANAILAAVAIVSRRGMSVPESLHEQEAMVIEQIRLIHRGTCKVPGMAERFDHLPSVSNYDVERFRNIHPIRVQREESVGDAPQGGDIKQWLARAKQSGSGGE